MIYKNSKVVLGSLSAVVLGAALAGCGGNNAADDTSIPPPIVPPSTTSAPPTGAPKMGTTTAAPAGAASFKDAAATWKQIEAANLALDKVIKSKNLKTVHEAAFKVRDIVQTLPAKSGALSVDKQTTLAAQVKNVEQLAAKLDKTGDSNNLKDTQENQAGLNDALDIIKGLYPSGALGK